MSLTVIKLPVFETMRFAWEKVSHSKATIWAVLLCILPIQLLIEFLDKRLDQSFQGEIFVVGLIVVIIATIALRILKLAFGCGLIYLAVQRARDLPIQFAMIKTVFTKTIILRMIGLAIIKVLIILPTVFFILLPKVLAITSMMFGVVTYLIGVIFCFVAIFFYIRLSLSSVLVVTNNNKIWEAITTSYQATESNVWRLIGLFLMNTLILIVSAIPLGIGLIWSIPYLTITYGVIYKKLIPTT